MFVVAGKFLQYYVSIYTENLLGKSLSSFAELLLALIFAKVIGSMIFVISSRTF